MQKEEFIDFLCERRPQCNPRSAKTHWYTLMTIYRLFKNTPQKKLPKTSRWVKKNILEKFKDFTPTKKRNYISTLVVYLRITKAKKSKIAWFCDQMYQVVKKIFLLLISARRGSFSCTTLFCKKTVFCNSLTRRWLEGFLFRILYWF